jgi:hypothetical protein
MKNKRIVWTSPTYRLVSYPHPDISSLTMNMMEQNMPDFLGNDSWRYIQLPDDLADILAMHFKSGLKPDEKKD